MIGPSRIIAVLGIDGSGKSTVARRLAETLFPGRLVCLVGDELHLYEGGPPGVRRRPIADRLRRAVHAAAKNAKSLKSYKVPKVADLLLRDRIARVMARRYRPDSIVMDGSPLLNMIAWVSLYHERVLPADTCSRIIGLLTGADVPTDDRDPLFTDVPGLLMLKRIGLNRLALPDLCIFLDVPPATACRRIRERGGHTQVHETEEKLDRLRNAYLEVCSAAREPWNAAVRVLDADRSVDDVLRDAAEAVREQDEAHRRHRHDGLRVHS